MAREISPTCNFIFGSICTGLPTDMMDVELMMVKRHIHIQKDHKFNAPYPSASLSDWSSEDCDGDKAKAREQCPLLDFKLLEQQIQKTLQDRAKDTPQDTTQCNNRQTGDRLSKWYTGPNIRIKTRHTELNRCTSSSTRHARGKVQRRR